VVKIDISILLVINFFEFNEASFINKLACIMEDNPENESIAPSIRVMLFLFISSKDSWIEGIENYIKPFKRYE